MVMCLSPNGGNRCTVDGPPLRLLAATVDGVGVLERAVLDAPWQVVGHMLPGLHVGSLLHEPRRGGLFAGTHGQGLYASLDGGKTWQPRGHGLPEAHVWTVAAIERDGQVVLYAGTQPMHLCQSLDYGETWQEVAALQQMPGRERWTYPPTPGIGHAKQVVFHPRDAHTIYFGIEQGGLMLSHDAGATWRELAEYSRPEDENYRDVHRLAISPANPNLIYMTTGDGLYKSLDAGETWEHLTGTRSEIGYPDGLQLHPDDDQTVFVSGGRRAPGVWRREKKADAGVARSRDGGRTWESLAGGLPPLLSGNIEALTQAVWSGGFGLYAGTTDGEVYGSDDGGERWAVAARSLAPISQSTHYRDLQHHPDERAAVGAR